MKILVTRANCFAGRATTTVLHEQDWQTAPAAREKSSHIKVNDKGRHQIHPLRKKENSGYTETDPPSPADPCAPSKWETEPALIAAARETAMKVVIIRSTMVHGPEARGNLAPLTKCLKRRPSLSFGAVNNKRSLIGLNSLDDSIARCAIKEKSWRTVNQLFLISADEDVSTAELLRKTGEAYGVTSQSTPSSPSLL